MHFFVIALVPPEHKTPQDINQFVLEMMSRFDENLEVDEYKEQCWCVGREAQTRANRSADLKFGKNVSAEDVFKQHGIPEDDIDQKMELMGELYWRPKRQFAREVFRVDPGRESPRSNCSECSGTGGRVTTFNPDGHWDWWRYGGRWDGAVCFDQVSSEDNGFNFGDHHEQLRPNLIRVKDWLDRPPEELSKGVPYCVITPDGRWIQRNEEYDLTQEEQTKEQWDAIVLELMEQNRDCWAVGIDCHS